LYIYLFVILQLNLQNNLKKNMLQSIYNTHVIYFFIILKLYVTKTRIRILMSTFITIKECQIFIYIIKLGNLSITFA